jgi:hypothetical protein
MSGFDDFKTRDLLSEFGSRMSLLRHDERTREACTETVDGPERHGRCGLADRDDSTRPLDRSRRERAPHRGPALHRGERGGREIVQQGAWAIRHDASVSRQRTLRRRARP